VRLQLEDGASDEPSAIAAFNLLNPLQLFMQAGQ
jgi:hypothetical protein